MTTRKQHFSVDLITKRLRSMKYQYGTLSSVKCINRGASKKERDGDVARMKNTRNTRPRLAKQNPQSVGTNIEDDEDFEIGEEEDDDGDGREVAAEQHDYRKETLKADHQQRPLWVCQDGRIFLETHSPLYKQACDFLIVVAEPACRPECIHEYNLTPLSLYAAASVGLETKTIIAVLDRLSKTRLADAIVRFIEESTQNSGKVKLVLHKSKFYVESPFPHVLHTLLRDATVAKARVATGQATGFSVARGLQEGEVMDPSLLPQPSAAVAVAEEKELHSFEIDSEQVEVVKDRCSALKLNYPLLEEYNFREDEDNPDLGIELKPHAQPRPYQEKSLSKMFGNGRARSGIIVLPCGAGKSLVGVAAAARINKSTLVLCTNAVSVDQWCWQFQMWSTISEAQITKFTSGGGARELFKTPSGIVVTTFNMIAFPGKRSAESMKIINEIRSREWGLLLMDEVHVVPAQMFRKVINITNSHCKLGLTATLVREDSLIADLNFLIGPKLYEANWQDLVKAGYIANVQCMEVWCPMTKEFYAEYLKPANNARRQALYVMNPNKFRAAEYLIQYHESAERRDKIIVFSDNLFALEQYAKKMGKYMIYGATTHKERSALLHAFKTSSEVNTLFLSKVGDNSIDIPEANVIIQISSHAGSRRQEAQRLGRILRAKGKLSDRLAGGSEEYNAFYYSLVSLDTQEMYYSGKRQQFLVDQGYSFKVVTNLPPPDSGDDLSFASQDEQLDLLTKVLNAGEEVGAEETLAEDMDDLTHVPRAARRSVGSMSAMSGAQGMMYMEYSSGRAKPKAPNPTGKRHTLFKQRYR